MFLAKYPQLPSSLWIFFVALSVSQRRAPSAASAQKQQPDQNHEKNASTERTSERKKERKFHFILILEWNKTIMNYGISGKK